MKCSNVSFWLREAAQGYADLQESTSQTWSNVQLIQEKAHSSLLYPLHRPCLVCLSSLSPVTLFSVSLRSDEKNHSGPRAKADKQHEDKVLTSQTVKCHIARNLCVQIQPGWGQKEEICTVVSEKASDNAWIMGQRRREESVERLKFGNSENLSTREITSPSRVSFWTNIKLQ